MRLFLIAIGTLAAGCTLSSSHGPTDDGSGGGGGGGGGSGGPVGRSFTAGRTTTATSPCPVFDEQNSSHTLDIEATDVFVDGTLADGVTVSNVPANQNTTAPNVTFSFNETWNSVEGFGFPQVHYTLWVDATSATGTAETSFAFDGTTATSCSVNWIVTLF
ncbi:MAG: hypothetical protein H6Q90_1830 [Deltaproteobacteria bacterium]|nr:hypothetical protein [Deltaproteobacteria bacterium]